MKLAALSQLVSYASREILFKQPRIVVYETRLNNSSLAEYRLLLSISITDCRVNEQCPLTVQTNTT